MELYSKNKRNEFKTLSSNMSLNKTPGYKSHLNLFHLSKKAPKYLKNLTIEEYDLQQNESLNKYREEGFDEEEVKNLRINKNKKNKSYRKSIFGSEKKLFQNPSQSLNVLTNNNNIYNRINSDSLLRQQILMDKSVKMFENFSMKFKTKMPKIKISSINSKLVEYIPMIIVENEKKEEESLPPIPHSCDFRLFSYFKYPEKNFPEGREQFSICTKGRNILLSGGVCTNMKEMSFWHLNIKNIEWRKISSINQTNNRYGHTTIYDENKVYIYGGRIKEKNKSILVGLEIFSLKEMKYYKPDMQNEPQDRRDHIALYLNNFMLIHGGVNANNEVLSDCHLLNLQNLKWNEPHIDQFSQRPKLYGHTGCLVMPFKLLNHKNFNIYKFPEIENNNMISLDKLKKKGIYIFGGKTKDEISNELWILVLGQKPFNWIKPVTKGKPPSPRYFHSMDFYEKANYLIIHGGRNDILSQTSALNDTFILDLENFEWLKIELYSNNKDFKVISRYGHKSTIFSNKLIIFGGMNNSNYIGSSLFIVNLDFYYSINMKTIEQMNIENIKKDDKLEHSKKMKKLQLELGKLKLGVVAPISLPPIK